MQASSTYLKKKTRHKHTCVQSDKSWVGYDQEKPGELKGS